MVPDAPIKRKEFESKLFLISIWIRTAGEGIPPNMDAFKEKWVQSQTSICCPISLVGDPSSVSGPKS
jgi:hypothetical protein